MNVFGQLVAVSNLRSVFTNGLVPIMAPEAVLTLSASGGHHRALLLNAAACTTPQKDYIAARLVELGYGAIGAMNTLVASGEVGISTSEFDRVISTLAVVLTSKLTPLSGTVTSANLA